MDGVSDLSEVIGKLSTYVGNIILRRMTSISNYINGTEKVGKIESFVNRLLGQIADETQIDDHMWLKGLLHGNPKVEPHDYLQLEFDSYLEDDRHPNTRENTAQFDYTISSRDYQLQLFISEYIVQSALQAAFWQGLLELPPVVFSEYTIPPSDVTVMEGIRLSIQFDEIINYQFERHGFNTSTMDCRAIPYAANDTNDIEPILRV